ncbi:IS3 family transposase [Sinomonas terricola]|uniref:IS3 family transposase n=1 Tax=Sinomonas terricola TaxID=3110330 RepID=UPI003D175F78
MPTAVLVEYIDGHRARFGVEPICQVLAQAGTKIAPSTYYAFKTREPSARTLRDGAGRGHQGRSQGQPRCLRGAEGHAALNREGIAVARCTVERLMRAEGLHGIRREKFRRTTNGDGAETERPEDLVSRKFTTEAPNQLWVADLTYVRTHAGWTYAAFVIDVFSRVVVGWQVSTSLRTDLALDALDMGLWERRRSGRDTAGLIHHSDRGVQYRAIRYTERLAEAEAVASVGSKGDSYDNAMAEAFNSLFKAECVRNPAMRPKAAGSPSSTSNWRSPSTSTGQPPAPPRRARAGPAERVRGHPGHPTPSATTLNQRRLRPREPTKRASTKPGGDSV